MTETEFIQRGNTKTLWHAYQILKDVIPESDPNIKESSFRELRSDLYNFWEISHHNVKIDGEDCP